MNLMLQAHGLIMLAGGSIPGDKRPLDEAERWGVTLAGLGIVMAALLLLVFIIFLFGRLFDAINAANNKKAAKKAADKAPKAVSSPIKKQAPAPQTQTAAPAPAPADADDDEVIAVISAVVAMMSAADGTVYQVKSVKPAAVGYHGRTAWAMDGRRNNVAPF